MTTLPKWTEERTAQLEADLDTSETVTKAQVAELAAALETSPRSVSSKLRKLGYEVELASAAPKAFSDEEAEELEHFVTKHSGKHTYAEIAEHFAGGKFGARAIQGKILSMELTGDVRKTPAPETTKTYTDDEQATIITMAKENAYLEDIADAVGKSLASVRGKLLSLLRDGSVSSIPKQREIKGAAPDSFQALGDLAALTVADIVTKTGKTERGVKTMLTRRKLVAKDYDGAAKAKKAAAAE